MNWTQEKLEELRRVCNDTNIMSCKVDCQVKEECCKFQTQTHLTPGYLGDEEIEEIANV